MLFISNLFPDAARRYRGLDNAVLLGYLREYFEEIRVVAPRPTLDARLWAADPWRAGEQGGWKARGEDEWSRPVYLPVPYVPKMGGLLNDVLLARRLGGLLRRWAGAEPWEFDGVLASWLFPDGCAVSGVMRGRGVPHLLIAQGSDVHRYLEMPLRRRKILRTLDRAGGLVTRSARLAELCAEAGAPRERLHPVYNGVDTRTFYPAADPLAARRELGLCEQGPVVLFVGNFLPVKNPVLLVRAFAGAVGSGQLVMIGSGPLSGQIARVAREHGLGDRILLPGRKEPGEVAEYMRAADCLALPSWNEGVPNVILEAFASGLPIVSTRVGGIHEVWPGPDSRRAARLVPAGNLERFKEGLREVLAEARGETGRASRQVLREHGERFEWQIAAEKYAGILKRIKPGK